MAQLLADFPGPLTAQTSRERVMKFITARCEQPEVDCSEPGDLKVSPSPLPHSPQHEL